MVLKGSERWVKGPCWTLQLPGGVPREGIRRGRGEAMRAAGPQNGVLFLSNVTCLGIPKKVS